MEHEQTAKNHQAYKIIKHERIQKKKNIKTEEKRDN